MYQLHNTIILWPLKQQLLPMAMYSCWLKMDTALAILPSLSNHPQSLSFQNIAMDWFQWFATSWNCGQILNSSEIWQLNIFYCYCYWIEWAMKLFLLKYDVLEKMWHKLWIIGGRKGGDMELQPQLILKVLHRILIFCIRNIFFSVN